MKHFTRREFIGCAAASLAASGIPSLSGCGRERGMPPDYIFHNGVVVTMESGGSVARAAAVTGDRIAAVGTDSDILPLAGKTTVTIDLRGRSLLPGLVESHAHPERASLSELDNPLPNPRTLADCLAWIRAETERLPDGAWIVHPKLFSTRLREMRFPSLSELDTAAPRHPVFLNASYGGMINTAAMRASGIGDNTVHPGVLRDSPGGHINGLLIYTAFGLLAIPAETGRSTEERASALRSLFSRYNAVGFTSVTSGGLSRGNLALHELLRGRGELTMRVCANLYADFPFADRTHDEVRESVAAFGEPSGSGDGFIRIGALKTTIDGGILTGTAYLREPWGQRAAEVFGIDAGFRGIPRMTADEYAKLVRAGAEAGWKTTAHCTGGGGVDIMLDAYERVSADIDLRPLRCSIIHGNFFTGEAAERAHRLGIVADMQPAWFYKDADAMLDILGPERIGTFHPYRTLLDAGVTVSLGSDHMVILDDRESINPYNPWLAIWSMVTRKTERGAVIRPEEAVTREVALRCYTLNGAFGTFEEDVKGSIETGKYADLIITADNFLDCHEDAIRDMRVDMTMVGGKIVHEG